MNAAARVHVLVGDITQEKADAVVNAADSRLQGGGGVDGAIHRAAGPELMVACRKLGGCSPGDAKSTPGFNLPAKWIIHTVGPVWQGGGHNEAAVLASAYRRSLEEAQRLGAVSVAFPAIATGVFGYPREEAAATAVAAVLDFLERHPLPAEVRLVCFSEASAEAHRRCLHSVDRSLRNLPRSA